MKKVIPILLIAMFAAGSAQAHHQRIGFHKNKDGTHTSCVKGLLKDHLICTTV
ncbi:hypothetical protein VHA01S_021_00140 [Vibrio halioticoli NBRC 102217]|uniref:Uncharacterized protein n=1 Tax=Vibrio halioticoli NBRC 102217 TaxID=1219072 RepID=V5HJT4_9VIBR|nr:hypothetical protein [Vibrio halioticoli]GAD89520.1 hypothetical protein VHA01S_021_00140 [Vibrio halioticoli NBRC 102217]